jgi:acetate---CoA ligase (ADP-forming)
MPHRLDPLLRPRSVAVVGASARPDSMGEWALTNLLRGGFTGDLCPVNPRHEELQGLKCYGRLAELPQVPELLIFAVADARVEALLDEAIALGIPAAVLMSPLVLDRDTTPRLDDRVRAKVREAGMLVCGANGMGFYNVRDGVWACGFDSRHHEPPGRISLISHSGSGMSGIVDCDERLRINVAVSTGNELGVTMDEYLDFVLDLPETRVVGLFVETARNPEGFRAALAKACEKRIPVVALKVGRTKRAAELTVSHSGAMAGDDAAYDALFDRYRVQRVRDMDELATALVLFAELEPLGPGGLVTLHDSGGERQLMVDLADEHDVPLTDLQPETIAALEARLDPGLPAVNPLDAWSRGGEAAGDIMSGCLAAMLQDPGAAMGAVVHDRAPEGAVYPVYVDYMRRARAESGKPVALVSARQGTGGDRLAVEATHEGFPVLDGVPAFLTGVHALMAWRDRNADPVPEPPGVPAEAVRAWRGELRESATLDEARSLGLLRDFGIATPGFCVIESADALEQALPEIEFPVALKSAAPGLLHKSDQGGVALGIESADALREAYRDLAARLGPRAIAAAMAEPGVEMILGAKRDPQFGPVVMIGFGGIHAEVLRDAVFALPPFDKAYARRRMEKLKMRPLLDGHRGKPPCDVDAFCDAAARFSAMVDAMRGNIAEIDVNPVIVTPSGAIAVDALVVARSGTR